MTEPDRWQPIETVPKDRYVLLFNQDTPAWDGNMEVAKWFGKEGDDGCFWSSGGPNGGLEVGGVSEFSHWMPLPEPADELQEACNYESECKKLLAEIERMKAAIAYVRQRSGRACEILNEFDATEPKP